ncbi:MAG: hypothetical protein LBG74_02615, partial [Spirochaetaceae bacterium]|nr:hypothetical protein [Spirochaetaceae bacterium]
MAENTDGINTGMSDAPAEKNPNAETAAGHAANEAAASPDAQASVAQPASAEQTASVPQTDEERVA